MATRAAVPNGYGGGAYVEGTLSLTECSLAGNEADAGGGADVANNGNATLTLNRSTVRGNGVEHGA